MLDCLIIGGGPAGLLAATYLARYRRQTCVIDLGETRAAQIPASHNYPGFSGIGGKELLQRLRTHAQHYGVDVVRDRVTALRQNENAFHATSAERGDVAALFVILATGLVDRCPPIHGTGEPCEAVSFCPICDGYEVTETRVGVVGDIAAGGKKALFLRSYSRNVSLFLSGDSPGDEISRRDLIASGVRLAGKCGEIHTTPGTVIVTTTCGKRHELDALYPALGCVGAV